MSYFKHYKVCASYSSCCFCERPVFPPSELVADSPRVPRKKMLESYAAQHGMVIEHYTPLAYGNGASASATLSLPCAHRQAQIIRLEVIPCL